MQPSPSHEPVRRPIRRRTKVVLITFAAGISLLSFVPLPLSVNARDREAAVLHAIRAVVRDRRVLIEKGFNTGRGYYHLEETSAVKGKQLYFANDLGIPDTVFLNEGLMPIPKERKFRPGQRAAVISFSNRDVKGKKSQQFSLRMFSPLTARTVMRLRSTRVC
jgi:hypothetical protein